MMIAFVCLTILTAFCFVVETMYQLYLELGACRALGARFCFLKAFKKTLCLADRTYDFMLKVFFSRKKEALLIRQRVKTCKFINMLSLSLFDATFVLCAMMVVGHCPDALAIAIGLILVFVVVAASVYNFQCCIRVIKACRRCDAIQSNLLLNIQSEDL